ncbi:hypothetical protein EPUL_002104 [Erysiphe pulchra]|uniref:Uncharacterized protein n=1 Tax=Erysiphe pulchra TaxID=225359 RepID=A0A2S4PR56_9PEZI|nr:hypothetical protein EPUL_002104 [Erysiphe pulchra]
MGVIKGLDLTNQYLQILDIEHPGIGVDSLALLADGASRAMRGERVYASLQNTPCLYMSLPKAKLVQKALKVTLHRGQSKENRRDIIRLGPNYEAWNIGTFELRQKEIWKTFIIGPSLQIIRGLDGSYETIEGPLYEELATVRDVVPIRFMGWTHRSQNKETYGHGRICVPESRADKFPSSLRVFGEVVSIQRIRQRN